MVQGYPQAYTSYPGRRPATKRASGYPTEGVRTFEGARSYSCEPVHDQWSAYPAEKLELLRVVEIRTINLTSAIRLSKKNRFASKSQKSRPAMNIVRSI